MIFFKIVKLISECDEAYLGRLRNSSKEYTFFDRWGRVILSTSGYKNDEVDLKTLLPFYLNFVIKRCFAKRVKYLERKKKVDAIIKL